MNLIRFSGSEFAFAMTFRDGSHVERVGLNGFDELRVMRGVCPK